MKMFGKTDRATSSDPASHPAALASGASGMNVGASASHSSVISEGFEFKGDMKSAGSLTVDGAIKGNLVVQALLIGPTGVVDGGVTADTITVEGCLSGTVECKDLVIGRCAVVDGKLNYGTITIQKGGTIKGDIERP
jgi:cytoskeletal protein CcmA (bactofilin family)